jgi:hypothetical protein
MCLLGTAPFAAAFEGDTLIGAILCRLEAQVSAQLLLLLDNS